MWLPPVRMVRNILLKKKKQNGTKHTREYRKTI